MGSLLGAGFGEEVQGLGGAEVLVAPKVGDGLDVKRLLQGVRVGFADAGQRMDGRYETSSLSELVS